jgi:hypothetical protein
MIRRLFERCGWTNQNFDGCILAPEHPGLCIFSFDGDLVTYVRFRAVSLLSTRRHYLQKFGMPR